MAECISNRDQPEIKTVVNTEQELQTLASNVKESCNKEGLELDEKILQRILARTGRLSVLNASREETVCTSTFLSSNQLLTAAHCVGSTSGPKRAISTVFVQNNNYADSTKINPTPDPALVNVDLDYAVLEAAHPLGADSTLFENNTIGEPSIGLRVYLPAYPGGELSVQSCEITGISEFKVFAESPSIQVLIYDCETEVGSSGGILYDDQGAMIAIHYGKATAESGERVPIAIPMNQILESNPNLNRFFTASE